MRHAMVAPPAPMTQEISQALHALDAAITRVFLATLRAGMPPQAVAEARDIWMAWGDTLEWQEGGTP